ncbi:arginine N-succinyltransferase [Oceanospirillum sediminis]|uniref:Arginine N-succinyltransferase n=1 Tax=Oceanospirillum sediminis TaxID=2760088 RepID=A0A839IRD8_9GAMM|nr:arginine N-succinyltransferase [Oceanospirillum sediminis]MBB1487234.1 arginine N-succinyltransferase [Oceanospirillum sediminis]
MLLFRPLTFNDLPGLERLAVISGGSMTTLPANRDHLSHLINNTQQSLRKSVERPEGESYHFALEDTRTGDIIGVSGIEAAVGISEPFYSYRMDEVVHASSELQIHNRIPALHLCQDYTGASRLYTLFMDAGHRQPRNLHLLSRARMLFMAAHPERFAQRLIVELQGIADENNRSPFWECLGRHFFNMDFNKANYLTGINSKGFIADLMPHYPVYVPLLSQEAQDALGQPREDMIAVRELLEEEGFVYRKYVDIFDAGPTLEARTDNVRSVSENRRFSVQIGEAADQGKLALISNDGLQQYRCLMAELNPDHPVLSEEQAKALQLNEGDSMRVLWLGNI